MAMSPHFMSDPLSPDAPTAETPKEETPAPVVDEYKPADAFDQFVGDFVGVRRVAIAFWNVVLFGFLVLLGAFIVLVMVAVVRTGSESTSRSSDEPPSDLSDFGQQLLGLIMTVTLTLRSLGSCCDLCCCPCCPRIHGKEKFALLNPFLMIVCLSVFYSMAREPGLIPVTAKTTQDEADGLRDTILSPLLMVTMVLLIIGWILWAVLLILNLLTKFLWWPAAHSNGPPPAHEEKTCIDDWVDWPFIHWIALVPWGLISIAAILCIAFSWVALRAVLLVPEVWATRDGGISIQVVMLMVAIAVLQFAPGEFIARLAGDKRPYTGCEYQYFLYAPPQVLIFVVLLTICYAMSANTTYNPAMLPTEQAFMIVAFGIASIPGQYEEGTILEVGRAIWNYNDSLSKASLAFVILSWIGVAVLLAVNSLSKLGIRPRAAVAGA
jgi:hypothetical protein